MKRDEVSSALNNIGPSVYGSFKKMVTFSEIAIMGMN